MSKDLFMEMREQEIATTHFLPTKKEIKLTSNKFAKRLLDSGEYNREELYAQALRLKEAISEIEKVLKDNLPQENFEAFGLKGTYRSGGDIPQFEEDEVYANLKKDLDSRKELLKAALKQDDAFFDAYGNEVPKVSTKPRKSSLSISF